MGDLLKNAKFEYRKTTPVEASFISSEQYLANRMWHDDLVLWKAERKYIGPDGKDAVEYGYSRVTKEDSPRAFILRDAVRRLHVSPEFASELLDKGEAYHDEVLAKHPNGYFDISPDLTNWVGFAPDGSLIGWRSVPTVENF
jgi:hypothetical protein